jgi:uncharacterized membrane protein YccC
MDQLETELRAALRRKPVPAGFGARLRARLPQAPPAPSKRPASSSAWAVWAVAAALVLALGVGFFQRERRVRDRNRAALEQTLMALSIAAAQLERAEDRAFAGWERLGDRRPEVSSSGVSPAPSRPVHSNEPTARN